MAVISKASATWTGDLANGSGMLTYVTSGAFARLPVSWGRRTGPNDGRTTPEEFLASAHATCFSMAFASRLAKNGSPATRLDVSATVSFEQGEGGWSVASSALDVRGVVTGIDAATFAHLADDAKENCPISRTLKGNVALFVEATLVEG